MPVQLMQNNDPAPIDRGYKRPKVCYKVMSLSDVTNQRALYYSKVIRIQKVYVVKRQKKKYTQHPQTLKTIMLQVIRRYDSLEGKQCGQWPYSV